MFSHKDFAEEQLEEVFRIAREYEINETFVSIDTKGILMETKEFDKELGRFENFYISRDGTVRSSLERMRELNLQMKAKGYIK